jgi:hypothetical protein
MKSNKHFLVFIFFFFSSVWEAKSQTIVNTYDLISPIDSIWGFNSELQGSFSAGNGVFSSINSGIGIGRQFKTYETWVLGGFNYASESGNKIYSTGFFSARLHYHLNKSDQIHFFYQNQFNSALLINNRNLIGANYSYGIKTKQHAYKLAIGAFKENETYSDFSEMNLFRANLIGSITTDIADVDVHFIYYYQPSIKEFSDVRMLGELSLQFPINDKLKFEIESALRYDSKPHLNLLPLDFSSLIGLVYSL